MLTLYREDILRLIEIVRPDYPDAVFQIGGYTLEHEISNSQDMEKIVKDDEFRQREYHCLNLIVQAKPWQKDQPHMILDISPSSCNLYLSDPGELKLLNIYGEIKKIIEAGNIFRFFRKKIFNIVIIICDILFIIYLFFLKDLIEKAANRSIPDNLLLLSVLLINVIFIIPHGKNKIYLYERGKVNLFLKNRENFMFIGVLIVIMIFIGIAAVNFMRI
jgi:hypothetical protein